MNGSIDVPSFFTESKTVWISENFQNILVGKYVVSEEGKRSHSIKFLDLQNIHPENSTRELVFQDADIFLEQLALLIHAQMNGKEGRLLNDSSANYFFLRAKDGNFYSVLVRWEPAQKLWRCGAYLQEDLKLPSIRVFYPE